MVAPVTGPFARSWSAFGPPNEFGFRPNWFSRTASWYRQRKPYDLPLIYESSTKQVTSFTKVSPVGLDSVYVSADGPWNDPADAFFNRAISKALEKLKEGLGEQSLWGVNTLEAGKSMTMISSTATTLWRFTRAVRKFDFPEAARVLKMATLPGGLKRDAKAFGNNWLAFHFGWEPLVKDIGAAVSTLQNPFPPKVVVGKATYRTTKTRLSVNGFPIRYDVNIKVRLGVELRLSNPNLYLANQLGFANPLSVAWELVPFSFVVDWFVNVGSFLGQVTDFAGLTQVNPVTTILENSTGRETSDYPPGVGMYTATYMYTYMKRTPGLPDVPLITRPWKGVSPVRAATAIALLVQQLR